MGSWPAASTEKLLWEPALGAPGGFGGHSRIGGPQEYEASIPALISDLSLDVPAATLSAAEEAGRELSRFDAELGHRVAALGPV
ncbi:MAG: hypothetical protein LBG11_10690, partial [Bifidobacteriaceae bacterium]|nr:hypothetical protein [Bifidobacteriaceae bacterium]